MGSTDNLGGHKDGMVQHEQKVALISHGKQVFQSLKENGPIRVACIQSNGPDAVHTIAPSSSPSGKENIENDCMIDKKHDLWVHIMSKQVESRQLLESIERNTRKLAEYMLTSDLTTSTQPATPVTATLQQLINQKQHIEASIIREMNVNI
jgi:hypothetical protein